MKSIDEFTENLIDRGLINLSFKDYSKKLIKSQLFNIPFTIDFIDDCSYDSTSCINNSNLVKYGIVDDENEIKDHLISRGYKENVDFRLEEEEIFIDQRLFKLLLIDSKSSNEYIKWYLTIEDEYRNYRNEVTHIKSEKQHSILWKIDKLKFEIEALNRIDL
jgi:hypothetical protein